MTKGQLSFRLGIGLTVAAGLWALLAPGTAAAQNGYNVPYTSACLLDDFGECIMSGLSTIKNTTGPSAVETDSQTSVIYDVCLDSPPYVIGTLDEGSESVLWDLVLNASCDYPYSTTADLPFSYPSSPPLPVPDVYAVTSWHCLDDGCPDDQNCDPNLGGTVVGWTKAWAYLGVPQITNITPTYGVVGSQGQITISGNYIVDPFTCTATGNSQGGISLTYNSGGCSQSSVIMNYSINWNAPIGRQSLTLSDRFGTSNGWPFTVYDPAPTITGVSPSTLQAGATPVMVTITGTGFGSVTPSIYFADPYVSCTGISVNAQGTQITCNAWAQLDDGGGASTVTVTSHGYGGAGNPTAPPGQSLSAQGQITVVPAPAPTPQIMFNGQNISSTTQSVVAGQQIALSVPTPNGYSVQSQTWSFSNQSAITGGFTNSAGTGQPSATGGGQEADDPPLDQNSLTFYWVDPGDNGETVTYTYTLNNGQKASATATFNIGGPTGNLLLQANMKTDGSGVQVLAGPKLSTTGIPLGTTQVGITFTSNATPPPGYNQSFTWVQIIGGVQNQYINSNGPFATPASPESGIDNTYPYANASPTATNDTPSTALPSIYGEGWESFTAAMFLMWDPALPTGCTPASTNATYQSTASTCTSIPIPLSSVTWHWSGCAINTLSNQTNGTTWLLSTSNGCPVQTLGASQSAGFPEWTNQVVRSN